MYFNMDIKFFSIFLNRNYSKLIMKLAILFEINNEKNEEEIEAKE